MNAFVCAGGALLSLVGGVCVVGRYGLSGRTLAVCAAFTALAVTCGLFAAGNLGWI